MFESSSAPSCELIWPCIFWRPYRSTFSSAWSLQSGLILALRGPIGYSALWHARTGNSFVGSSCAYIPSVAKEHANRKRHDSQQVIAWPCSFWQCMCSALAGEYIKICNIQFGLHSLACVGWRTYFCSERHFEYNNICPHLLEPIISGLGGLQIFDLERREYWTTSGCHCKGANLYRHFAYANFGSKW